MTRAYCMAHGSMEEEPSGRCYRWLHSPAVPAESDCGFVDATCIGCIDGPCNPWCETTPAASDEGSDR